MSLSQIQTSLKTSHRSFILIYIISLFFGLFIWPIWGWIIATQVGLTIFSGLALMELSIIYITRRQWYLLVAKLFTPGILWLLFGLGTIVCFVGVENIPFYGYYEDIALLLNSIYVFIGASCYLLGFHALYKLTKGRSIYKSQPSEWRVTLLLFILLAFDWYARLDLIRSGTYFTWVMRVGIDETVRGTNLLFQVQRTIWAVILPLSLYKLSMSRRKWFYSLLIGIELMFVIGSGDRSNIIISLVILLISYSIIYNTTLNSRFIVFGLLVIILFFTILGPMIQEARYLMRSEGLSLLENPNQVPKLFFTQYLPAVVNSEILFDVNSGERQSLLARIGSYPSYFASIQQAYRDGRPLLGFNQALDAMTMLIPRILYPKKEVVDADYVVQLHFNIGLPGRDAAGTFAADAFAHLHIFGITLLFLFVGGAYGLITRHLVNNYNIIGEIIIVGFLPAFIPLGDSFALYLSNLRNILLVIIVLNLGFHFGGRRLIETRTSSDPLILQEGDRNAFHDI